MELLPIIQLAVAIFATVVFFIILISYMIYKSKEKKHAPQLQVVKEKNYLNNKQTALINSNYDIDYYTRANKGHSYVVPKTQVKYSNPTVSQPRTGERFNIVNNQHVDYQIYETNGIKPRTSFQPNHQIVQSPSLKVSSQNSFDNYNIPEKYFPRF